jgi:uncharacterized cupredoxin-like copper-binding protein
MRWTLAAALVVVACGACREAGDEAGSAATSRSVAADSGARVPTQTESAADSGASASAEAASLPPMEITGTATDTLHLTSEGPALEFRPDRLTAASGTRVLLRYENAGDLPHNFVLFRRDEVIDGVVAEAYESQATGFIPASARDDLIAYSLLVSPGASAEMEFVVPAPGEYTFICLFPGHAQMMLGTLTSLP